jgi:hypothetical protein
MKYIEEFVIVEELGKYAISETPSHLQCGKPTYTPWNGGCAIHNAYDTIDEARKYIFDHATYQIQIRIDNMRNRITKLESATKTLNSDVFNLAIFKMAA